MVGAGTAGGVVLAGGRSSRMGRSKAALEWDGSTLLARTCRVLAEAGLAPLVVVTYPNQPLPALPPEVEVVADPVQGRGPVQGIAAGLAALAGRTEAAFLCATDLPFLRPELVRRVLAPLADDPALDVVLPVARGHQQPLAAAYRTRLAGLAAELVSAGRLRAAYVVERARALVLDEEALLADRALREADPHLESLLNVNTPEEYERARRSSLGP